MAQPPEQHEIVIEHQGKKIRADYYIEDGYVTVEVMSKNGIVTESVTLIGGSAPEVTTRILLKGLIASGRIWSLVSGSLWSTPTWNMRYFRPSLLEEALKKYEKKAKK